LRLVNMSSRFFDLTHFHLAEQATSTASEPCQMPVPEHQTTVQHHPWPLWGPGVHLASLSHVCVFLAQQHMVWSGWWYSYLNVHRFY
jgi:hypothetical protein